MSSGPARGLLLLCLALALGCSAPEQRYAAYEPYLVRFELATEEHADSLEGWYACFETEDMESKLCLSDVPGVRVDAGHGASCAELSDPATLCRAFPYFTPDRVAAEDEEESDDDSGSVAGAVAEGLVRVFFALVSSHDDDEDDDDDEGDRQKAPSKSSDSRERRFTISKPEAREYRTKTPRPR